MINPLILLTNDDGMHSPGLAAAAEALLPLGRLVIAAPLHQQTSMGRAQTGNPEAKFEPVPYTVNGTPVEAYSLEASPAAVVRHFFMVMCGCVPDIIVSGINYGENIGLGVTCSGTVGAALEGAMRGSPALAVSLETDVNDQHAYTEQDWAGSIHFTRYFAEAILRKGRMAEGVDVLKVEVPAGADAATPWRLTRLSPFMYIARQLRTPALKRAGKTLYSASGTGKGSRMIPTPSLSVRPGLWPLRRSAWT